MNHLNLDIKRGLKAFTKCNIYENGILFYIALPKTEFNLPAGQYTYEGDASFLPKPVDFSHLIIYPKRQKNIKVLPFNKIEFGNNPNKCSVWVESGRILWDIDFYKKLKLRLFKYFILLHEKGHFFYFNEEFCDQYAKNKLLEAGYNPSQIWAISKAILTGEARPESLKLHLI